MLRKYPLLPLIPALVAGVLLSLYSSYSIATLIIIAACLATACGLFIALKKNSLVLSLLIIILFVFIAAARTNQSLNREVRWEVKTIADSLDKVDLYGFAFKYEKRGESSNRVLLFDATIITRNSAISLKNLFVWVYADTNYLNNLEYGDILIVSGSLKSASEYGAISKNYFLSSLINQETAALYADSEAVIVVPHDGYFFRRFVDRFREYITATFSEQLSEDGAALCNALILGDKHEFSQDFTDKIRLTGLSHIFALSGMNVGLIISLLWLLMGLLFVPIQTRLFILILVTLFYMEVGRESPSLVRASLMCVIFLFGRLIQRHGEILNFVAAAACIELLWRPLDLLDVGFQLSYLAVLSILAFYHLFYQKILSLLSSEPTGLKIVLTDVMAGTLASQVGTIPTVGFYFARIPLLGVFANIIAVPGFAILLFWSILLLITEAALPQISFLIANSINLLVLSLNWIVEQFAKLPLSALYISEFSVWHYAALYLVIIGAGVYFYFRKVTFLLPFILLSVNIIVWQSVCSSNPMNARVSFIDVGNGDAILISTPTDQHILVDTGPHYRNWSAASRIVPFLSENRIQKLDAVILTHPDNDHVGGTAELIRQIPIERIYFNGDTSYSRVFTELLLTKKLNDIKMDVLSSGDRITFGDNSKLSILYPDSFAMSHYPKSNQRGLVIRIDCGEASALLTADIDSLNERDLLNWGTQIDADLLKVAHHGSGSSSCSDFISSVSPDFCVVTAGRRNNYGHPSEQVLSRLKALNVPVYITGRSGSAIFDAHGTSWKYIETKTSNLAKKWNLPYA